jgi:hypothetical protein
MLGDALASYAERICRDCFATERSCRNGAGSIPAADVELVPHVIHVTDVVEGTITWSKQTTETLIGWTMLDRHGEVLWSDIFYGAATGNIGNVFTRKGNLRKRHTESIEDLYRQTVAGITRDPTIRLYAACAPLFDAPQDMLVEIGEDLFDRAEGCSDYREVIQTVLLYAAQQGHLALTEAVLARGAEIDHHCPYFDTTPLGLTMVAGHFEYASYLVDAGADIDFVNGKNRSLFYEAALRHDQESLRFLAGRSASFAVADTCGHSAMTSALCYQSLSESSAGAGNDVVAREYAEQAASYYDKAADHFAGLSREFERKRKSAQFRSFLSGLGKFALMTVAIVAEQYNARYHANRRAEMRALRDSRNAGGGLDGYFQRIGSYRQSEFRAMRATEKINRMNASQKYGDFLAESEKSVRNKEDLAELVEKYTALEELCRNTSVRLREQG